MGPVSRLCPEVHPRTAGQNRTHHYTPDGVPSDVPGQPHLGASARDTEGTAGRSVPLTRKEPGGKPRRARSRAWRQLIAPTFFFAVTMRPRNRMFGWQVEPTPAFWQFNEIVSGESFVKSTGPSSKW